MPLSLSKTMTRAYIRFRSWPASAFLACLSLLLFLALTACPQTPPDQPPDTTPEQPVAEQLPLRQTPGLHLVYTVNDPHTEVMDVRRTAHVLIADPSGERREVLFSCSGFIFHTVPSPSGAHVAFVATAVGEQRQEERHVFIYDLAADRYRDVSTTGLYSRAAKTAPIFTPDGGSVLFLSRWSVDYGEFNVFMCDVATGRTLGLYTDPVEEVPLSVMPDGRHCVAVRRIPNVPGSFEYISIDLDTGAATALHRFDNVTKVGPAHFDPSGTTIYCDIKAFEAGAGAHGIVRSRTVLAIDLDSDTARSLLEAGTVTYVYQVFPDANGDLKLLLRRQEDIEGEDTPMSRIAVSRTDGSDFQYLTGTEARHGLLVPPSNIPPISPDRSLLFYFRHDPVFVHKDIWVMTLDGSNPVNISDTAGYNEGSAGWIVVRGE